MGLITLIILLAITVVYLHNSLENKIEVLGKVASFVTDNMKYAHFIAAYAGVAIILCWFTKFALLKFIANLLILVMLSPNLYEKYSSFVLAKGGEKAKVNVEKALDFIKKQQEYVSYAGLFVSALLFLLMF